MFYFDDGQSLQGKQSPLRLQSAHWHLVLTGSWGGVSRRGALGPSDGAGVSGPQPVRYTQRLVFLPPDHQEAQDKEVPLVVMNRFT